VLQECGAAGATSGKRVMTAWMSELDRGQGKHNKISVMYSEPLKVPHTIICRGKETANQYLKLRFLAVS
jgi:hypothetical protein